MAFTRSFVSALHFSLDNLSSQCNYECRSFWGGAMLRQTRRRLVYSSAWKRFVPALAIMGLAASCLNAQQKLEAELASLRDGGFTPSAIQRPAGPFLLVIKNRSSVQSMAVQLVRKDNGEVIVAPVSGKSPGQSYLLTLSPGVHVLSDADHPERLGMTITIH